MRGHLRSATSPTDHGLATTDEAMACAGLAILVTGLAKAAVCVHCAMVLHNPVEHMSTHGVAPTSDITASLTRMQLVRHLADIPVTPGLQIDPIAGVSTDPPKPATHWVRTGRGGGGSAVLAMRVHMLPPHDVQHPQVSCIFRGLRARLLARRSPRGCRADSKDWRGGTRLPAVLPRRVRPRSGNSWFEDAGAWRSHATGGREGKSQSGRRVLSEGEPIWPRPTS